MSPDVVTPVSQVDFINGFLEAIYKDVHRVSDLLHEMGIKESVISALRQEYLRPYLLVLTQRWQAVLRDELPERHAEILIRRYALHSQLPPTLNALGEEYGASRERIRQLQEKGLRRMRAPRRRQLLQHAALEAIYEVTQLPSSEVIDAARQSLELSTTRTVSPAKRRTTQVEGASDNPHDPEATESGIDEDVPDHVRNARQKYPRAYERWSIEEDGRLQDLYRNGTDVAQISALLERQPSAIRSRLTKLGLLLPTN